MNMSIANTSYGRRFEAIVEDILKQMSINYVREKKHSPKPIHRMFHIWALEAGREVKARTRYYIPDFTLTRDRWVELTIWESEAHNKAFLYSHQCKELIVLFLCGSEKLYWKNPFPNTKVSGLPSV